MLGWGHSQESRTLWRIEPLVAVTQVKLGADLIHLQRHVPRGVGAVHYHQCPSTLRQTGELLHP